MKLTGTAVSGGIAIAPAFVYRPFTPEAKEAYIEASAADAAFAAFEQNRADVETELLAICESFSQATATRRISCARILRFSTTSPSPRKSSAASDPNIWIICTPSKRRLHSSGT